MKNAGGRIRGSVGLLAAGLIVTMGAACGGGEQKTDTKRMPLGENPARSQLPEGVPALLDSGNAAYRTGDYQRAESFYRRIVDDHPDLAAAWFGIYMAERAMGNQAAADSALSRAGGMSDEASEAHVPPGAGEVRVDTADG